MGGDVILIVKIDERTKAAIEEILSRRKDVVISVRKGEVVIYERTEKMKYRTTQSSV